jgi:hypothetical protein
MFVLGAEALATPPVDALKRFVRDGPTAEGSTSPATRILPGKELEGFPGPRRGLAHRLLLRGQSRHGFGGDHVGGAVSRRDGGATFLISPSEASEIPRAIRRAADEEDTVQSRTRRRVKLHELRRQNYRSRRDLDHLDPSRLSERLADVINNSTVITERKRYGLGNIKQDGEARAWMILNTEIFEQCVLRGYAYPGPLSIAPFRDRVTDLSTPVLDVAEVLKRRQLGEKPYVLKFGKVKYLRPMIERDLSG